MRENNPDKDYLETLKIIGIKILNSVEMISQEAAWYLLRIGMSESSREIIYIPTKWPFHRLKTRKSFKKMDLEELDDGSIDIWCKGIIEKYEDRPQELSHVSFAEFVSCFTFSFVKKNIYFDKKNRIIRYRNYDISDITNYKREMVTLYYPFRNEEVELLDIIINFWKYIIIMN